MLTLGIYEIVFVSIALLYVLYKVVTDHYKIQELVKENTDLDDELTNIEGDIYFVQDVECTCPKCGKVFTEVFEEEDEPEDDEKPEE